MYYPIIDCTGCCYNRSLDKCLSKSSSLTFLLEIYDNASNYIVDDRAILKKPQIPNIKQTYTYNSR